jgi:hypothetical protein
MVSYKNYKSRMFFFKCERSKIIASSWQVPKTKKNVQAMIVSSWRVPEANN